MKWIRRAGIALGIVVFLLLAGLLIFLHSFDFAESEEDIQQAFSKVPYEAVSEVINFEGQLVHYMEIGDPEKPKVMFVHGSPGSWDNFLGLMTNPALLEKASVIAVTRPGYGRSGKGIHEPSLKKQAAAMLHILDLKSPGKPAVLVGHSFGGPVVARMAMDAPEKVAALVLAAASIDPEMEKVQWFQVPANWPPLTWLLPDDLLVCNREILALKTELEAMMPLWPLINHPVTIIHGEKDNLVPIANADFAARMLTNASLQIKRFPTMNHFVIWTHPELMINSILELLPEK